MCMYILYKRFRIICITRTASDRHMFGIALTFAKAGPICVVKAYQMHFYIISLGKNLGIGIPFKIYHDIIDNR